MPRTRKQATKVDPPNSVVASAARMNANRGSRPKKQAAGSGQEWQNEAWTMFDSVGELSAATMWVSNALSRVRLRIMEELPDGTQREVPENATGMAAEAVATLESLFDGETGQPQMMAAMGVHMSIPGEAYLVGLPTTAESNPYDRDWWRVLSNEECSEQTPGVWQIDRGDGMTERYDINANPDDPEATPPALIIRVWRAHPRKQVHATSPVRAALPILRELVGLTKDVASSIDSRLAGAGVLLVPSEMTFQTPLPAGADTAQTVDDFLDALTEAMAASLADRSNPAARVPIIVKVPGALIENVKHITFDSPLTDQAQSLREEAVRRLALSIDLPPDVLLGQGDSNHWSAWLVDESAIKVHIEPLVGLITNALTTRFLWSAMDALTGADQQAVRKFSIDGDTSALRQRPNHTTEAVALHGSMVLTDAALLRETGFGSGDLLDPASEEFKRRLLQKIAANGVTPEVAAAAFEQLGIVLDVEAPTGTPTGPVAVPDPPAPAPAPEDARDIPNQGAALMAVSEVLISRAVERAWNRAGRRGKGTRRPVPAEGLDAGLADAWVHVPRSAALCGVDAERLHSALDTYARGLLVSGAKHDPNLLDALLRERVLIRELAG